MPISDEIKENNASTHLAKVETAKVKKREREGWRGSKQIWQKLLLSTKRCILPWLLGNAK